MLSSIGNIFIIDNRKQLLKLCRGVTKHEKYQVDITVLVVDNLAQR